MSDAANPGLDEVTPAQDILDLSPEDRALRVRNLTNQAYGIFEDAVRRHSLNRKVVATAILFSGGNDSATLAHVFRKRATHAIHANTGIGIERTREFVRETCQAWGIPLLEEHPPAGSAYRDLVIDQGFPGPGHHFKMYQRLKERGLRQARKKLVKNGRRERVVFLAGRRREESVRRAAIPLDSREGSIIWCSPLAMWTKLDLNTYRQLHAVPRNEVSDLLHMSGECLCGAFAHEGELDEIGLWYPEVASEIRALEAEVRAAGHPEQRCRWGHGNGKPTKKVGSLCTSCTAPSEVLRSAA